VPGDLEFDQFVVPDEREADAVLGENGSGGAPDVGQAVPGKKRTLLHIEKIPVGLPPDDEPQEDDAPDPSDWRPAPGLILPDDTSRAFSQLEQNHAGFVITSYSRMKSLRGGYSAPIDTGADLTDEPEGAEALETAREALPGGSAAGIFLHEVLEAIDFETLNQSEDFETWAANEYVRKLFRKMLRRHAFSDRYLTHSQKLVHTALTTPIQLNGGQSICFHQVKRDMREVEFVYPYPEAHHPSIAEGIEQPFRIERGYVKGFVDFVFEHRGLTYFADWKSDALPTWDAEALSEHVQRNYKLQAQLYALALIKMLGIHTEKYYEAKFGGLLYVFLRAGTLARLSAVALAKADAPALDRERINEGVYFERPSWSQILDWERELTEKTRL
jgi:exodeoxyribonuclease V beta subunit